MAKKRSRTSAEQAEFDERTRRIDKRIGNRAPETEERICQLRVGTFDERTKRIENAIARLSERIATKNAATAEG
jgi:hypothetical protein